MFLVWDNFDKRAVRSFFYAIGDYGESSYTPDINTVKTTEILSFLSKEQDFICCVRSTKKLSQIHAINHFVLYRCKSGVEPFT